MIEPDIIHTGLGPLALQPIEHASLVLGVGREAIYVDPVGGGILFSGLERPTGILLTHEHGDHLDNETLEDLIEDRKVPIVASQSAYDKLDARMQPLATVLRNGEMGLLGEFPVEAVPAHNTTPDRLQYHPEGVGNGYILTIGGIRFYIAGDTEPTPAMLGLANIDVAFLPMNLPYTMVAEQAAEAVKGFRPKVIYPYHYTQGSEPLKFAGLMEGFPDVEVRLRDWYSNSTAEH